MSIQRKPKSASNAAAQDAFIAGAPDARPSEGQAAEVYNKGIPKGHKRQITLTIAPEMLRKVDEVAKRTGQGRAGIINMAIYRALEGDIFK